MPSPSVVVSTPTAEERPTSRFRGDAAAQVFRHRVKALDRVAQTLISVGGISIICAVLGIGVFLVLEITPFFRRARLTEIPLPLSTKMRDGRMVLVDEHQERALVIGREPVAHIIPLAGRPIPAEVIPLNGLEGQEVTAAARTLQEPRMAFGTNTGQVWIGSVELQTVFNGTERIVHPVITSDAIVEAVPGYRIQRLAYRQADEREIIASVVDNTHVIVTQLTTHRPLIGPVRRSQASLSLPLQGGVTPTTLLINRRGTQLLIGTSEGQLLRWRVPATGEPEVLETMQVVPAGAVTAVSYLVGERSVAVGGRDGSVATWSLVRDDTRPDGWHLTRLHTFPVHPAPITLMSASPRDRQFLSTSSDGLVRLYYMTTERTLAELIVGEELLAADIAPKANGLLILGRSGVLRHWGLDNPHPEISWKALFGKVWYEGYNQPEYVWQSTGGSDDAEPKLSLVPLIFGTMKGTGYTLLFAVPLALLGALYCSQFLDKRLRSPIKSMVELMAALPSVVLGFIAGVLLAPLIQGHLISVFSLPVMVPVISVSGLIGCSAIPIPTVRTFLRLHEFWILTAFAAIGVVAATLLGPWIERMIFHGDLDAWLLKSLNVRYDQRNALVVGWVMGFAVIPIIFTMCEDAFSSVPRHLVSASLACGASLWQTAWRVVLPAAGSGVFSGIMVGFGRAVGETMIVLMATGNTPIMDWNVFNGFRALSANIAVEIPEAPYGGTLYRVLFVSALLLFAMTSVVNTAAELIRLHLRRQLKGL